MLALNFEAAIKLHHLYRNVSAHPQPSAFHRLAIRQTTTAVILVRTSASTGWCAAPVNLHCLRANATSRAVTD